MLLPPTKTAPRGVLPCSMADPPSAAKPRPRSELVMRLVQPVASAGVRLLAPTGLNPLLIVLTHASFGFTAALLLILQPPRYALFAALLLLAKMLLDNMDGALARVTGQITQMGRYFDTGMDFFVNIALFIALAWHGPPLLSLLAFVLLTLMLSLDYNAERLYKLEHRGPPIEADAPLGAPRPLFRFFKALYDYLLAPQDALIATWDKVRFENLSGLAYSAAPQEMRRVWADLFSTAALVNLGLSTQMVIFSVCLLLRHPFWYVYSIFLGAVYVLWVQLRRARRFRRYLRTMPAYSPPAHPTEEKRV